MQSLLKSSDSNSLSETTALLQEVGDRKTPKVVPMRYRELVAATRTAETAFANEPFTLYLSRGDTAPFRETRWRLINGTRRAGAIYRNRMFTVDASSSFLQWSPNRDQPWIITLLLKFLSLFSGVEFVKRWKECDTLSQALIKDAFGDSVSDMYEIQALAVDPNAQGRGYGTALVKYVTDKSDAECRDTWVLTTTAFPFYERLGYSIVRTGFVGADNPKWDGEPFAFHIMHRPARPVSVPATSLNNV